MPFLSLPKAVASNRRTRTKLQPLISIDLFRDLSDRTLTFGKTGSIWDKREEFFHVYMREEEIHMFSYFVGADDRWVYSHKFQVTQIAAKKLRPGSGAAWLATDEEFASLMESSGSPLFFIPMDIWDKPLKKLHGEYYGHVPGITCKPHPDDRDFSH